MKTSRIGRTQLLRANQLSASRRVSAGQVARRIEGHLPGIRNRLISVVDLMNAGQTVHYSPAFKQRLVEETREKLQQLL